MHPTVSLHRVLQVTSRRNGELVRSCPVNLALLLCLVSFSLAVASTCAASAEETWNADQAAPRMVQYFEHMVTAQAV